MWCPDCKEDFATVPGSDVQVCPKCRAAAKAGRRRRRLPRLDPAPKSTPKLRIDGAHKKKSVAVAPSSASAERPTAFWRSRSLTHMVAFGLFVFLIGQAIHVWAFLAGHFIAWSLANLISVLGVAIAFIAVSLTLRNFERRIRNLARLVGRAESTVSRKRNSRKSTSKQS